MDESISNVDNNKRNLLRTALIAGVGVALASTGVAVSRLSKPGNTPLGDETIRDIAEPESIEIDENSDILLKV